MDEIWRPIAGYEGYYEVSNHGRVRSLFRVVQHGNRTITISEKILKSSFRDGYEFVGVSKLGKTTTIDVHRLVASAFVDNPDPSLFTEVNHKDRNKRNNRPENLEWVTHVQNVEHAKLTVMHSEEGKRRIREGSKHSKRLRPVLCKELNRQFSSIAEASRSGLPISLSGIELSLRSHRPVNNLTFIYLEA